MGTDCACGLLFCATKRSGAFPPNMPAGLRARVSHLGGFMRRAREIVSLPLRRCKLGSSPVPDGRLFSEHRPRSRVGRASCFGHRPRNRAGRASCFGRRLRNRVGRASCFGHRPINRAGRRLFCGIAQSPGRAGRLGVARPCRWSWEPVNGLRGSPFLVGRLESANGFFFRRRSYVHHGEPVNCFKGNPFLVERLESASGVFCWRQSYVRHKEPVSSLKGNLFPVEGLESVSGFFFRRRSYVHHGEPAKCLKGSPILVERLESVSGFSCTHKRYVHHGEPVNGFKGTLSSWGAWSRSTASLADAGATCTTGSRSTA
jgi:hypothetical protein